MLTRARRETLIASIGLSVRREIWEGRRNGREIGRARLDSEGIRRTTGLTLA